MNACYCRGVSYVHNMRLSHSDTILERRLLCADRMIIAPWLFLYDVGRLEIYYYVCYDIIYLRSFYLRVLYKRD